VNPATTDRCLPGLTRRTQSGATFIELMLAVLIISTTLVASTASMHTSSEVYHYFSGGEHDALMLAQEIHEAALLLPWETEVGASAAFGTSVYDLFDLDGAYYTPPRSAEYDLVISHIGWSQTVSVKYVDLNNPDVEVDPEEFVGEKLVKLSVTIKEGDVEVDKLSWWLSRPTESQ
jgi:hypothetical protein